jgi:hypothetical protein
VRIILVALLGVALGIGGTIGVQAMTDASDAASQPSFRSEVRKGLAEEWGDIYAECVEAGRGWSSYDPGAGPPTKAECKARANAVLP